MKMFSRSPLVVITLAVLSVIGPAALDASEQTNTKYIESLNYDLKKLLSVSLEPTSQPADTKLRTDTKKGVIICTKTENKAFSNLTENALLNPSGGVIFPGALVKEDRRLAEGVPTPITLPRAPITIRLDLQGLGKNGTRVIENPTNVTVPNAIDEIVDYWFTDTAAQKGYKPISRAFYVAKTAYTTEQIGIDLGFSAQWGSNSASSKIDTSNNTEQTIVLKSFKQIYFTASVETPQTAGSVFQDNVVLTGGSISAAGPPGLVRSVDYGRIIIVEMTINNAESKINAEGALDYVTSGGTTLSGETKATYEKIKKNSQFKVLALGGSATDSATLFEGNPDKIFEVIEKGIAFSKDNPAYPISYQVADLKTQELAKMSVTTDYTETDCQEYANGWVEFFNEAGYVATFYASWKQTNDKGELVRKTYDSGNTTAGWRQKIWLPGDASEISLKARAWGAIRPWPLDERPNAVPNKCYKVYGTIFGATWGGC